MAIITGVRFKRMGKVYYFDPNGLELEPGVQVVVETARGTECAEVGIAPKEVHESEIVQPLKKVLRVATAEDIERAQANREREARALDICQKKAAEHKLEMNLVEAEYAFDGSKIVFYFTADGRVDFRALVRDLASVFKTRIELRQIGVRDEVKLLGGLGACGREVCCRSFLKDFAPVSIRMAKDQNLSLNPTKISGLCGRLMCCLGYEQSFYQSTIKRCPKRGSTVQTSRGVGTVQEVNILKERIKVRFENKKEQSVEIREYRLDELDNTDGIARLVDVVQEKTEQDIDDVPDVVFMDGSKAYDETRERRPTPVAEREQTGEGARRNAPRRRRPGRDGQRKPEGERPAQGQAAGADKDKKPGGQRRRRPENSGQPRGQNSEGGQQNRADKPRKEGAQPSAGQGGGGQRRRRPRPPRRPGNQANNGGGNPPAQPNG